MELATQRSYDPDASPGAVHSTVSLQMIEVGCIGNLDATRLVKNTMIYAKIDKLFLGPSGFLVFFFN